VAGTTLPPSQLHTGSAADGGGRLRPEVTELQAVPSRQVRSADVPVMTLAVAGLRPRHESEAHFPAESRFLTSRTARIRRPISNPAAPRTRAVASTHRKRTSHEISPKPALLRATMLARVSHCLHTTPGKPVMTEKQGSRPSSEVRRNCSLTSKTP